MTGNANFWKSKYRYQNCYSQILENANRSSHANKETRRTNNADRGFTSGSGNVVTPGDFRFLRVAREAAKTRDLETIDARKSVRQDSKTAKQFMDNRARELKVSQKALKTARAQNCMAQANTTKYPADASAALAAQETNESEVQAGRMVETCAESAYESRCSYESARGVKSFAGVRRQTTRARVSPESSSNNAATLESECRKLRGRE